MPLHGYFLGIHQTSRSSNPHTNKPFSPQIGGSMGGGGGGSIYIYIYVYYVYIGLRALGFRVWGFGSWGLRFDGSRV